MNDTIAALASGRIPAGIAVIRISGPHAFSIVDKLTDVECLSQSPSTARVTKLYTLLDRNLVDQLTRAKAQPDLILEAIIGGRVIDGRRGRDRD